MLTRLLSSSQFLFSIRLKGPASQRVKKAEGEVVHTEAKKAETFFKDYSP